MSAEEKLACHEATRQLVQLLASASEFLSTAKDGQPVENDSERSRLRDLALAAKAQSLIEAKAMVAAQWVHSIDTLFRCVHPFSLSHARHHSPFHRYCTQGPPPMDLAIESDLPECARVLLAAKCDANGQSKAFRSERYPYLGTACASNRPAIVKLLLEARAATEWKNNVRTMLRGCIAPHRVSAAWVPDV